MQQKRGVGDGEQRECKADASVVETSDAFHFGDASCDVAAPTRAPTPKPPAFEYTPLPCNADDQCCVADAHVIAYYTRNPPSSSGGGSGGTSGPREGPSESSSLKKR